MKKILILAANPRRDLNLDREIRDLEGVIDRSNRHDALLVVNALAVRVEDLQELLFKHRPQIVHFCGHGGGDAGLIFASDVGREHLLSTDALANLFRLFASTVECVLLNACYSKVQADSIVDHIAYVIGMQQAIRDDAAIAFSKGFYRAIAHDCSIEDAFEFGCNAIELEISGSSVMRASDLSLERKLNSAETPSRTVLPEHLKPELKKNAMLCAARQTSQLSQQRQTEIQMEIASTLGRDRRAPTKRWWLLGIAVTVLTVGLLARQFLLPHLAQGYVEKGLAQFQAGDRKKAEANYQSALRLVPDQTQAHLYLGILYEDSQQIDQALAQYKVAARQDDFTAINNLSRLYILKQQNREAAGLLINALKLEPRFPPEKRMETKYAILKNLGWVTFQQGDYSSAGDYLDKAIALKKTTNIQSNLGAPHCLLAQVYEKLQDKNAKTEWEACLSFADPSNPDEQQWLITATQRLNQGVTKRGKTQTK